MRQKSRKLPIGAVSLTLLVLFVFIFSIREFAAANSNAILERNSEFLQENTEHHAKAVSDILQSRLRFVENLAVFAERSSESDYLTFIDTLDTIEENTFLDALFFVTTEGKRYPFEGQQPDLKETEFYQSGMRGESGISEMQDSLVNPEKQCVAYYAPVWRDGRIAGLITGCNYYESFDEIYEMTPAEAYIRGFLADGDGNILLSGKVEEKENVFIFLNERMESAAYEELLDGMENSNTICTSYRGDHGDGLVCFSALGINDWYILQLFPSEKTAELVAPLNKSAYTLETAMFLCMVLVAGYTLRLTYVRYNQKNRLMEMALEALADSYPRIAKIDYQNDACVFVKDRERIVEKAFQKYEWTPVRTKLLETIHPEDLEKFKSFTSGENMRRVKEQGLAGDTCTYRRKYEGEYQWIQTEILPVEGEENCILMYAGKVDEAVKAEESYKQQLWLTMQKVKAAETEKSELLKYMSRNLRIPVEAMKGMTLLTDASLRKGQREEAALYLNRVDSLSNYTMTMLEDMMQFGRGQESHIRCSMMPFSVQSMLNGYREYCEEIKQNDRDIRVEVICDEHLKAGYIGDEARIMQVLHALLENAFRFSREGGLVVLRADLLEAGEKADSISFAVCDTGQGMNEEYRGFLVEALSGGCDNPEGGEPVLGMGLSLAKLALNSMGGKVKIESTRGEGTRFTMMLTLEHAPETGEKPTSRVLVVDDNEINLEATAETLAAAGYRTTACGSGDEALKLFLDSEPGTYQVLLTDIKMPGMDGRELAKFVRNSGRGDSGICILGMMASYSKIERTELLKGGLDDVTEKPLRLTWFNEFLQKRRESGMI